MRDLFEMMQQCANKNDIQDIKIQISAQKEESAVKIAAVNVRIDDVVSVSESNTERIEQLEAKFEVLKQDQLKNNICISGVPCETVEQTNTAEITIAIAKTLGVTIERNHFTSYPVAGNKFIIVIMHNNKHKQTLLNKIRVRKSLMVQEVLDVVSNSQIYLNDHLTPYFNRLYMIARKAKKEGNLASASSYGGKIRARKSLDDAPMVITSEKQLLKLMSSADVDTDNSSIQLDSENTIVHQSTPRPTKIQTSTNTKGRQTKPSRTDTKSTTKQKSQASKTAAATTKRKAITNDKYDANRDLPPKKNKSSNDNTSSPADD